MTYEEFLEENKEFIADLTVAEKIKFATAYEWGWPDKPSKEDAYDQAKQGCTTEKTSKRNIPGNLDFESELGAISFISKFAGLTQEESQQLDEDVFSKNAVTPELAGKIKAAFESKGIEKTVIEALGSIHNNWIKNHPSNFQKQTIKNDGTLTRRDKDYQFVDLRLMSFGNDGAKADLIFLRPILEACGISIDMKKLEEEFFKAQKQFLEDNGIHTRGDLINYLRQGSLSYPPLEGLTAGDLDHRPIDELIAEDAIVEHMTDQVVQKSGIELIDEKMINEDIDEKKINEDTDIDTEKNLKTEKYNADDFEIMSKEGTNLEKIIAAIEEHEKGLNDNEIDPKNPNSDDPHSL